MTDIETGKKAVQFAREIIESSVRQIPLPDKMLGDTFKEKHGVFVSIHTFPANLLRGCIGIPEPVMPLQKALIEAATSATKDPRFPPLSETELDNILVEVTILTKPVRIHVNHPREYPTKIKIGRDGLIVKEGYHSGLLLPQVPVEQGWDEEEFLSNTCMKAWLPPDAWLNEDTQIYRFSGRVFTEIEPRGEIKEKRLNGRDRC